MLVADGEGETTAVAVAVGETRMGVLVGSRGRVAVAGV